MALIRKNIMTLFYFILFLGFLILSSLIYMINNVTYDKYILEQENLNKVSFSSLKAVLLQYESTLDLIGNQLIKNDKYKSSQNSREILDSVLKLNPSIVAFGLTDTNGEFYATSSNLGNIKLQSLTSREITKYSFNLTLKTETMVIGRTYFHKKLNQLIIPIRKAVRDEKGNVVAVMTAGLYAKKMFSLISNTYHRHIIFRDFDNFVQMNNLKVKNINYTSSFPSEYVNKVLNGFENKYNMTLDEIKHQEKLMTMNFEQYDKRYSRITTIKYINRYMLWNMVQIDESQIKDEIRNEVLILITIFIIINTIIFFLFKNIHRNEENKQKSLLYQATHDSLTKLYNRNYIRLKASNLESLDSFTLLFIDIDNFKSLNDTYGHVHGDQTLKQIANRLLLFKKGKDILLRYSGDEFLLITELLSKNELKELSCAIIEKLCEPYIINECQFILGCSIGIAQAPMDGKNFDDVKRYADIAMYEAKKEKNTYHFFDSIIKDKYLRRLSIEQELKSAISNDEIYMMYQPQVDNKHKLYGVESLVRWENKNLGFIPPDEFIQVAEESGLMPSIGSHIIKTVLKDMKEIIEETNFSFQISINISVKQFMNPNFIDELFKYIKESEIKEISITLEITENIFINDFEYILKLLNEIKNKKIKLSLDDFGTGYSSLSMLRKLPLDELKVDKAFVDDIENDIDSRNMAQNIISIGKQFNMIVLAEGIEVLSQKELLEEMGCDLYQGYYFSKPLKKSYLKEYIDTNKNRIKSKNNSYHE